MADERLQHTEQMVGAGHATKTDTLNRLTLIEHNSDGTHKEPLASLNSNFLVEHNSDGTHMSSGGSPNYSVGEKIIASSNAGNSNSLTPLKVGEIALIENGDIRVDFDLEVNTSSGSPTAYGQIYKNDVAEGTLRSTMSSSPVTYSEDISNVAQGDLISLYVYVDNDSRSAISNNFKIKADKYENTTVVL